MEKIKEIYYYLKGKYEVLTGKKYSTIAGTLVYFFIMSVIPFSFWLTLIVGRTLNLDADAVLELELLADFQEILLFLKENAESATGGASFVLVVTTLYSSTNLFYHMRRSGEMIYGYTRQKGGLKVRVSALVLMLLMIALFALFLIVFASGYYLVTSLFDNLAGEFFGYLFIVAMSFFLSFILNLYICPYRLEIKEVLPGSLATTFLWIVAAAFFTVYLRFANMSKLYGAVSAVIVALLWLYVMMNCFVIGVIYNSEKMKKTHKPLKRF